MTREDILAMPAGRELDALVAEKVMGWETSLSWGGSHWIDHIVAVHEKARWKPSTDISASWEVVEKMNQDEKFRLALEWYTQEKEWGADFDEWSVTSQVCAKTAPEAICKAALIAVLEESL